jgi:putative DNA primase/helicase
VLGAFLAERCQLSGEAAVGALRESYDAYCKDLGERPLTASTLGKRLAKRGIKSRKGSQGRRSYAGVSLR